MKKFSYTRPAGRDEALKQVAREGAAAWAGGMALIVSHMASIVPLVVVGLRCVHWPCGPSTRCRVGRAGR